MSDILSVSAEAYLSDPCGALPAPFGVCRIDTGFAGGEPFAPSAASPCGALHLGGASGAPGKVPEGAYYRLYHPLGDMRRFTVNGYSARRLFPSEEGDDALLIFRFCGDDAGKIISSRFYTEELCVAVHSRETGECRGVGAGHFDPVLREAWIVSLSMAEGCAGGAAERLLISELLRRMAPMARFATVCVGFGSGRERLLRKCGFTGGDIWLPPDNNRIDPHIIV